MSDEVYFIGGEPVDFSKFGSKIHVNDNLNYAVFDPFYNRVCTYGASDSYCYKQLSEVKQNNSLEGYWIRTAYCRGKDKIYHDTTLDLIVGKNGNDISFRIKPDYANNPGKPILYLYTNEDQNNPVNSGPLSSVFPDKFFGDIIQSYMTLFDIHIYTKNDKAYLDFYENGKPIISMNKVGTNVGIKDLYLYFPSHNATTWNIGDAGVIANSCKYTEVLITNFDTRAYRLKTLPPAADGSYTEAIGNYININGLNDDNSFNIFTQLNQKYSYKVSALTGLQSYMKVKAVSFSASGMSDNINKLQMYGKYASSETTLVDFATIADTNSNNTILMQNNPNTGQPWLQTELPNIEFCFKSTGL